MSNLYHITESIIEDTQTFQMEVGKFLSGETSVADFKSIRVPMGIYEQREDDTYMLRVRGAAGLFLSDQIKRVAELASEFGNGLVHVTTRQDFQIHRVDIADTPAILDGLLDVGLHSRGGGGNTVRNISACPLSGVCTSEVFDVTPYALALTEYFIQEKEYSNLPRKFKVAFSGCRDDCALASIADLGFFAHENAGTKGFSVYAAGGMGSSSKLSILLEDFIPTDAIFETAEALKRLFAKHGDRTNRMKARLRYVVERVGSDKFQSLYKEELEQVRSENIQFPQIKESLSQGLGLDCVSEDEPNDPLFQQWKAKRAIPQKQQGLYTVAVPLQRGDIESSALSSLADLAVLGNGTIRTTQDQGLLIPGVPGCRLSQLYSQLGNIGEMLVSTKGVKTVACVGSATCRIGLCRSSDLAEALDKSLADVETPFDDPIYISGCHNSCGQHARAAIGLFGKFKRVNDRMVPFYAIVTGGYPGEGDASLAELVAMVPARAIPALFEEFWVAATEQYAQGETLVELLARWGTQYLAELAKKYENVPTYEESPEFYKDFGCQ